MNSKRLEHLQEITKNAGLDAMVLIPGDNLRYLTGLPFHTSERPLLVIVPSQGEAGIIIPSLEMQQLVDSGFGGHYFPWTDVEGYEESFEKTMGALGLKGKRIGVEGLNMRVLEGQMIEEFSNTGVISADEVLVELRIIKADDEIENHRKAIKISEDALEQLLPKIELGMTERQIAKMLSELQVELGGEADAFGPIVLVGARSAFPHGIPSDARLQAGDTLLIDYGTIVNGYVSDITRVFFAGEPSDRMRSVYEAVLAANEMGRKTAKPGVICEDVDKATAQVLREKGFGEYVKHRTGHGLGIGVHEHPNINIGYTRALAEGMVFTIEPGLYVEGELGVRIEDNMVVTGDGVESMTSFPRELRVLDLK
jgi:Xaa-Pro dipeptidase